jgi:pyridoxal 5'-phosphate synthase pdxT subunit
LLGVLDVVVQRNAFGRQNESFETDLDIAGLDGALPRRVHPGTVGGRRWERSRGAGYCGRDHPVMVRQGRILGTSFHPELTGDDRIHQMLSI